MFGLETPPEGHTGMQRIVSKFLWLPKKLQGQWKWLVPAQIVQESVRDTGNRYKTIWEDREWEEKGSECFRKHLKK